MTILKHILKCSMMILCCATAANARDIADGQWAAPDILRSLARAPSTPTGAYQTPERDVLTSTAAFDREEYARYVGDRQIAGMKSHVRHRVLDSELGRWGRRDPLRHADDPHSLLCYTRCHPIISVDPTGLGSLGACTNDYDDKNDPPSDTNCWTTCEGRPHSAGLRICIDGVPVKCCICWDNIANSDWHWVPAMQSIVGECTEPHEQVRMERCPDFDNPQDVACQDAAALRAQIECLEHALNGGRCGDGPECRQQLEEFIEDRRERLREAEEKCMKQGATRRPA